MRSFVRLITENPRLDFGENKDEYIQMLYDRTPTLPQRLRLGDGYIRNFWKNFGSRIAVK